MKTRIRTGKAGLSIVEIMVSAVVFVIIIACVMLVFRSDDTNWQVETNLITLEQKTRYVMDGMIREIREGTILEANPGNITFTIPDSANSVRYYLSDGKIMREHPSGTTMVLTADIESLVFSATPTMVQVKITSAKSVMQRPLSFTLTEKVRLRNKIAGG